MIPFQPLFVTMMPYPVFVEVPLTSATFTQPSDAPLVFSDDRSYYMETVVESSPMQKRKYSNHIITEEEKDKEEGRINTTSDPLAKRMKGESFDVESAINLQTSVEDSQSFTNDEPVTDWQSASEHTGRSQIHAEDDPARLPFSRGWTIVTKVVPAENQRRSALAASKALIDCTVEAKVVPKVVLPEFPPVSTVDEAVAALPRLRDEWIKNKEIQTPSHMTNLILSFDRIIRHLWSSSTYASESITRSVDTFIVEQVMRLKEPARYYSVKPKTEINHEDWYRQKAKYGIVQLQIRIWFESCDLNNREHADQIKALLHICTVYIGAAYDFPMNAANVLEAIFLSVPVHCHPTLLHTGMTALATLWESYDCPKRGEIHEKLQDYYRTTNDPSVSREVRCDTLLQWLNRVREDQQPTKPMFRPKKRFLTGVRVAPIVPPVRFGPAQRDDFNNFVPNQYMQRNIGRRNGIHSTSRSIHVEVTKVICPEMQPVLPIKCVVPLSFPRLPTKWQQLVWPELKPRLEADVQLPTQLKRTSVVIFDEKYKLEELEPEVIIPETPTSEAESTVSALSVTYPPGYMISVRSDLPSHLPAWVSNLSIRTPL